MGYLIPAEMPAWRVEIYALAIAVPTVAAKVGWLPSTSHPARTFRSREAAERHADYISGSAKWSLVPIKYRGEIIETTREPTLSDKVRAYFNLRPVCGDVGLLCSTHLEC